MTDTTHVVRGCIECPFNSAYGVEHGRHAGIARCRLTGARGQDSRIIGAARDAVIEGCPLIGGAIRIVREP